MGIDMDLEGIPSLVEIHGNESGGASEGIPGLEAPHIDGLLAINEQYIPIYNIPSCDCLVLSFCQGNALLILGMPFPYGYSSRTISTNL